MNLNLLKRQFKPRKSENCRRCQKLWIPGFWNLHGLCPSCFELFDDQKYKGREKGLNSNHYESSDAWIKDNPIE